MEASVRRLHPDNWNMDALTAVAFCGGVTMLVIIVVLGLLGLYGR